MDYLNPLEHVSEIEYITELNNYMDDPAFKKAVDMALNCIVQDDMPPMKIALTIRKLAAYSLQFHLGYVYYMGFGKGTTNAAAKKNTYRSTYEALDKLVDALKYMIKV